MGIKKLPVTYEDYVKIIEDEYKGKKLSNGPRGTAIADSVIDMFLRKYPSFIRPFARKVIYSLLDDPIRIGLGYPKQSILIYYFALFMLFIRAFIIRLFLPIRPLSLAVLRTPVVVGGPPRYQKHRKHGCPFAYPDKYDCNKLGTWNHKGVTKPIN